MTDILLKEFLEEKYHQYNKPEFIETDPVSIPHSFSNIEDIEISGFLAATIAWGVRKTIVRNAFRLMKLMDNSPYDFIKNASDDDMRIFESFKHRTFNGTDAIGFIKSLKNIYINHNGLRNVFEGAFLSSGNIREVLIEFRKVFLEKDVAVRTRKHISNVDNNASAKRLNMFLRWMVRKDHSGVDFGLWDKISPSALYMPLDVHSGNIARKLGLLERKQNDWKSVELLTTALRKFDPADPVKYDYALFGLGIFEHF